MRKIKSIDEIYEEVRNYDMVITNDAPLATALNGRIDTPRIGGFAYTPRQIASMEAIPASGKPIWRDLKIITEVCNETGYDLKFVHGELENIKNIRKYTADVEKYLYSRSSREIYRSFAAMPTIEKVMAEFTPDDNERYKGKKVAIIGIELFNDLDKHFIPNNMDSWDEIEIFTDGEYEIDTIYEIGNDREIAENIVEMIDRDSDRDTAIVIDTSGPIADAVRSALYRRRMPFKNTMTVKDISNVRDYLQFLSLALSYDTLRIKHVRELISSYGGGIDASEDEYLLKKRENKHSKGRNGILIETMKNIRQMTFMEVSQILEVKSRKSGLLKIVLDDMEITDIKITEKKVNEIIYAVNNVADLHHNEETPEEEKKGVLIADCRNSIFIDRAFVIYVGLGPEWAVNILGKDYIDREDEAERNAAKFTILMQQGTSKLYAVNSMRNGKESIPCPTFDQLYEESKRISSFDDVCNNIMKGAWYSEEPVIASDKGETGMDPLPKYDWQFSKTSLGHYCACPRAYMFADILRTPDADYTIFGSIVHEFAEFYLCYPEIVKKRGLDHYVDVLSEKYSGLSCEQMKKVDDSELKVCMHNIMRFIDSLNIGEVPLDRFNSDRKYQNALMEEEGCEKYSSITEIEYSSKTAPLHGNFDLILNNRIIDYKTGKIRKPEDILNRMDINSDHDYYDFQPMIYLSLLKDNDGNIPGRFSLFFAKGNEVESATDENFPIGINVRNILLLDSDLQDSLEPGGEGLIFSNGLKKHWSKFFDCAISYGFDNIADHEIDDAMINAFLDNMGLNHTTSNTKLIKGGLGKLRKILEQGMYTDGGVVCIPLDSMEKFMFTVSEMHKVASLETETNFPATPRCKCTDCDFFQVCTKDVVKIQESDDDE